MHPMLSTVRIDPQYEPITFAQWMLIGVVQHNITVRADVIDTTAKGAYPSQKRPC